MATVIKNTPGRIEFKNLVAAAPSSSPALVLEAGDWDAGTYTESGIIVETTGVQLPLLSANDARKLAKWLNKAAEDLDGVRPSKKSKQQRPVDDDDGSVY